MHALPPRASSCLLPRVALAAAPGDPDPVPLFEAALERMDASLERARVQRQLAGRLIPRGSFPEARRALELARADLAEHPDRVVSRSEFLTSVWGYPSGSRVVTRTVENTIGKLRKKIERDRKDPQVVITVHGSGWKLGEGIRPCDG